MKLVGARVDALTCAYRVELDEEFVAELRKHRDVARRFGRVAFEWRGTTDGIRGAAPFDVGVRWRELAEDKPIVGEFTSLDRARYQIKREPSDRSSVGYRILVLEHGPGGSSFTDDATGEVVETPGWTVEIVWYAETLASWGVDKCLAEGAAIAWRIGKVEEQAIRRVDLCADVAGWEIHPEDAAAIVKRPRASYDVARDASELDELGERKSRSSYVAPTTHEAGKPGVRRVCGLSIGAGGALMCRVYNKVLELSLPGRERKREIEHLRWRDAGWDGVEPVTRVEFQIRGQALRELGLRDPEAMHEAVIDAEGHAVGQRIMRGADGRPLTLSDRLPWVWATMTRWVRLVVPDAGQQFVCRLETQWRWRFLDLVSFGAARPIQRCRIRGVASAAQSLGVALSQAARAGELDRIAQGERAWSTEPAAYPRARAEEILRERIEGLMLRIASPQIIAWLLDRWGDPIEANVRLAHAARARWARFASWEGIEGAEERAPPLIDSTEAASPRASAADPFAHWSQEKGGLSWQTVSTR